MSDRRVAIAVAVLLAIVLAAYGGYRYGIDRRPAAPTILPNSWEGNWNGPSELRWTQDGSHIAGALETAYECKNGQSSQSISGVIGNGSITIEMPPYPGSSVGSIGPHRMHVLGTEWHPGTVSACAA
jgi:hypothetical protein